MLTFFFYNLHNSLVLSFTIKEFSYIITYHFSNGKYHNSQLLLCLTIWIQFLPASFLVLFIHRIPLLPSLHLHLLLLHRYVLCVCVLKHILCQPLDAISYTKFFLVLFINRIPLLIRLPHHLLRRPREFLDGYLHLVVCMKASFKSLYYKLTRFLLYIPFPCI